MACMRFVEVEGDEVVELLVLDETPLAEMQPVPRTALVSTTAKTSKMVGHIVHVMNAFVEDKTMEEVLEVEVIALKTEASSEK